MKKCIIVIITVLCSFLCVNMLFAAADTWTQKANFTGTGRSGAVGFAIGSKGYIGTGNADAYTKDFWEYNPAANTWTQKADFGGTARSGAIGFSIRSKGYIGTGLDGSYKKDFWEYNPAQHLDAEGRFRRDSANCSRWLLYCGQRLCRDGRRRYIIYKGLLGV